MVKITIQEIEEEDCWVDTGRKWSRNDMEQLLKHIQYITLLPDEMRTKYLNDQEKEKYA